MAGNIHVNTLSDAVIAGCLNLVLGGAFTMFLFGSFNWVNPNEYVISQMVAFGIFNGFILI